jgi:proteasome lid subunit RPN8/RPN11
MSIDNVTGTLENSLAQLIDSAYAMGHKLRSTIIEGSNTDLADEMFAFLKSQATPISVLRQLQESLAHRHKASPTAHLMSSRLLVDCYHQQCKVPTETIHYGIGSHCGKMLYLEQTVATPLESSSAVHANADDSFSHQLLGQGEQHGSVLVCYFHMHPGRGPGTTRPSGIDTNYQERLEAGGYRAIGCIFSRDGYLRFFSNQLKYRVIVTGKGIDHVKENIYKINCC